MTQPPASDPKIFLVGNPNVGKSVLFNALTGAYTTVSNYPGTSVEVSRGHCSIDGMRYEVLDTPGTYALQPMTEEEAVTQRILLHETAHLVIHVVDARNLERMLPMTLQLVEAGLPRLDLKTWIGLFAPAGTPVPIPDMLNQIANDILRKPEALAWFDKQGLEPVGGPRAPFASEVRADYQRWGRLVRQLGLGPR